MPKIRNANPVPKIAARNIWAGLTPIPADINRYTITPTNSNTNRLVSPQMRTIVTPSNRDDFWTRTGITPYDLGATGVQLIGNLASSLINQAAINRLKFTPIHTPTVAETPVKFNTTYNINPQLDNLRESIGAVEREATNNSASSRNTLSRILGSRLRGVGAYNDLYGQKLNQETNMMNIDAQNRQGVYARNTNRLQQNLARDTMYNTQGQDNLDNTKAMYTGRNWSNFTEQAAGSFIGAYNRGQHRLKDINDLSYFYAANPNSAPILMNRNSPRFRNILNNLYDSFGFKLGGKSSLIRK